MEARELDSERSKPSAFSRLCPVLSLGLAFDILKFRMPTRARQTVLLRTTHSAARPKWHWASRNIT